MCIIFILYQVHPTYPLIIASNRDEMLDRPTESMKLRRSIDISPKITATAATAASNDDDDNTNCRQEEDEEFDSLQTAGQKRRRMRNPQQQQQQRSYLAGRDLVGGGTWLAIDVSSMRKVVDLNDDDDSIAHHGGDDDCNLDIVNNSNKNSSSSTPPLLRWIAITNYREKEKHGRPSRGELLTEYITQQATTTTHQKEEEEEEAKSQHSSSQSSSSCCSSSCDASSFLKDLQPKGQQYNGFNLLVGDDTGIYYHGNRTVVQDGYGNVVNKQQGHDDDNNNTTTSSMPRRLMPGRIYGLSNALLDTPWPKVERGKELFEQLLIREEQQKVKKNSNSTADNNNSSLKQFHEKLQTILHDTIQPPNNNLLPNTGIGLRSERHLSSIFVPLDTFMGKEYGTRSSTSVVVDVVGRVSVLERSYWLSSDEKEMKKKEEEERKVVDEWFYYRRKDD